MTRPRHRRAVVAALALTLCAPALHAGTVIDLASEDAPFIHGTFIEEQFGHSLAIGDLDGDGAAELIVGAPGLADSTNRLHTGAVFVFPISTIDALSGGAPATDLATATVRGASEHDRFGTTVAVADLDGDGFDDLAVGAPAAGSEGDITRGEVAVYFGGPSALYREWPGSSPDATLTGGSPGARLGSALLARDINSDGAEELLISAPGDDGPGGRRSGNVYVVEGAALRSGGATEVSEVATATINGEHAGDALAELAVADTDGDDRLELVLGAWLADGAGAGLPDAGRLYVVPAPEIFEQGSGPLQLSEYLVQTGTTERGFFGKSLSVGDIDYDGIDDLLVSACASKVGRDRLEATGEVFVLFGNPDGRNEGGERGGVVAAALGDDIPRIRGASRSDLFGLPVLLADLNGDGASDIIAAAQYADGPGNDRRACGEVCVYWGSLRSVMAAKAGSTELADVTVVGALAGDSIGGSLATAATTGGGPPVLLIAAPNAPVARDDGETVQRCGKLLVIRMESLLR